MVTAPNNLGATLLLVIGSLTAPVGVGIVLVLSGLALLRQSNGERSFPRLHGWIANHQVVQFCRMIRL